jgi:hypothetical protein
MLVAGAGGLWLIIRSGSGLAATTDLSGQWAVGGEDTRSPRDLGGTLFIEQSGRHFRLNFERGLQVDMKVIAEARPDSATGQGLELRMAGGPWTLTAFGPGAGGPLIFRLNGPEPHTFTVSREPGTAGATEGTAQRPASPPPGDAPTAAPASEIAADAGSHAP